MFPPQGPSTSSLFNVEEFSYRATHIWVFRCSVLLNSMVQSLDICIIIIMMF